MLPRNEYDRLVALAAEAQEDAAASRIVRNSARSLKEGREVVLPKAVADRLANGDNAVRVIREWRDMIQGELAVAVGISQNYLSEIETGRRKGTGRIAEEIRAGARCASGSLDRMKSRALIPGSERSAAIAEPRRPPKSCVTLACTRRAAEVRR